MTAKETFIKLFDPKGFWELGVQKPTFQITHSVKKDTLTNEDPNRYEVNVQVSTHYIVLLSATSFGATIEQAEEKALQILINSLLRDAFSANYLTSCISTQKRITEELREYYSQPGRKKKHK